MLKLIGKWSTSWTYDIYKLPELFHYITSCLSQIIFNSIEHINETSNELKLAQALYDSLRCGKSEKREQQNLMRSTIARATDSTFQLKKSSSLYVMSPSERVPSNWSRSSVSIMKRSNSENLGQRKNHFAATNIFSTTTPMQNLELKTPRVILDFPPMLIAHQLYIIEVETAKSINAMEILHKIDLYEVENSILFDEKGWVHTRTCVPTWRRWIRKIALSGLVLNKNKPIDGKNRTEKLPEIVITFERVCPFSSTDI